MRIKLREIVGDGLDIVDQVNPADLELNVDFIDLDKPVIVRGHLERVSEFVIAKLTVSYTLDTVCARCLDPIDGETSFDLEADIPFRKGDEYVDLASWVREEILTGFNPRMLCQENCKGICPGCGAYLNTESCECGNRNKETAGD